jgi:hypothetical protein
MKHQLQDEEMKEQREIETRRQQLMKQKEEFEESNKMRPTRFTSKPRHLREGDHSDERTAGFGAKQKKAKLEHRVTES